MFKKYPVNYPNTFAEFAEGNEKANKHMCYLGMLLSFFVMLLFVYKWYKGEGGIFGTIFWGTVTLLMPRGISSNKERRAEFFEELFSLYPELASPYFTFEEADYLDRRLGLMIYGEHLIAYADLEVVDLTLYNNCYYHGGSKHFSQAIIFTSDENSNKQVVSIYGRGEGEHRENLYDYLEEYFDIQVDQIER